MLANLCILCQNRIYLISAFSSLVHGHYGYVQVQCRVPDSKQHIEFIFSATYNMIEYLRYNSSESKIIGNTEFGKKLAEDYNKNNILLAQSEFVLNECKRFGDFIVPISGTTGEKHFLI